MAVSTEERRIVTVLFADMAGSTALGEALDPEEMRRLLARYYVIAREAVDSHGGTIEKFIGDAVMAVFGLPTAHGDDADRAVAAALTMRDRIRSDPQLAGRMAIRFGVSTGEVVASRDQSAGDFLVTGDPTNVAARLQQSADPWSILASDRTVRAAVNHEFGDEIHITAKGKSAPVAAREVLGPLKLRANPPARLPLVGRETDLAQLQLVARRVVKDRRPSMVSVIAPAGTGKTRLVEEFLDWLPTIAPEATVTTAQCLPYGQQLTYWPMRQVLFTLTGTSEDTPPADVRDAIRAWLSRIGVEDPDGGARLLATTIGEGGTEGADRELLFAAWRSALEATARHNPLVVVFEDLHWSSDSLLDLAEFVMQPRGESAVLMIVLARPELLDRRPNWGGGRLNHLALALEPLATRDIADLVRTLLDTDLPNAVNLIADRSEGNPFYANELVRSYLEHNSFERLPDTVQGTVLARLDLLPPAERRIVQLGSVFGRAFRAAGVAALEGAGAAQVEQLCDSLVDRDLIRPAEGDRYTFRHILIQEVAYGTLPRAERARLHAQAARWVESTSEGREVALAEILAFHYREAAVLYTALAPETAETESARRKAAEWLLKAADVAAAVAATPEAVRHSRAAFDFIDAKTKARLHERIGDWIGGDTGLDDYRQALDLYEKLGASINDELRAVAGFLTIATRFVGGVGERPSDAYVGQLRNRGRRLLEQATDKFAIGRFLAADAFFPFWVQSQRPPTSEELNQAVLLADRAREIAIELGDADLESTALDARSGAAQVTHRWTEVLDSAHQRIAFASRLGFNERLDSYAMATWASYSMGDLAGADRESADIAARLLPGQAPSVALHLFTWRALALDMLGRWDDAVAVFWRAIDAWHDADRLAAGYALRGFAVGLDVGRARGDSRLIGAATDVMGSVVSRISENHYGRSWAGFIRGEATIDEEKLLTARVPAELVERRLNMANDARAKLSEAAVASGLTLALTQNSPLLEAQLMRSRALLRNDSADMSAAMEVWERCGAEVQLARATAERGLITGNAAEIEAGLAALKKIGDANYVDRFSARI